MYFFRKKLCGQNCDCSSKFPEIAFRSRFSMQNWTCNFLKNKWTTTTACSYYRPQKVVVFIRQKVYF